jgi:hypothetical protein
VDGEGDELAGDLLLEGCEVFGIIAGVLQTGFEIGKVYRHTKPRLG